jgi:copper chaperone
VTERLTLTVTGMTCGGCENAVKRVLSTVEGVANVTASHVANRVTLDIDTSKTTREAVSAAIARAGYKVAA